MRETLAVRLSRLDWDSAPQRVSVEAAGEGNGGPSEAHSPQRHHDAPHPRVADPLGIAKALDPGIVLHQANPSQAAPDAGVRAVEDRILEEPGIAPERSEI